MEQQFGPGLRLVLRLALLLIGAWLVHAVVVLVSVMRDLATLAQPADDLAVLTDAEIGEAAPWEAAPQGVDRVRDALDLFEQRYREAVERPVLRFGADGSPEFVDPVHDDAVVERFDADQWRRDRRQHGR